MKIIVWAIAGWRDLVADWQAVARIAVRPWEARP